MNEWRKNSTQENSITFPKQRDKIHNDPDTQNYPSPKKRSKAIKNCHALLSFLALLWI